MNGMIVALPAWGLLLFFQAALADRVEDAGHTVLEVIATGPRYLDISKVKNGGTAMPARYEAPFALLEQRSRTTDTHCCCVVSETEPVEDKYGVTSKGIATDCKDGSMTSVTVVEDKDNPAMSMEESMVNGCPKGTKDVYLVTGAILWECDYGPRGRICLHQDTDKPCPKTDWFWERRDPKKKKKEKRSGTCFANSECRQGQANCMCKEGFCIPRHPEYLSDMSGDHWTKKCEKKSELNAGLQLMKYPVLDPKHYTDAIPYPFTVDNTGPTGQDHPNATETDRAYGVIDPLEIHPYRRVEDVSDGQNLVAKRPQEGFRDYNARAREQLRQAKEIRSKGENSPWAKYYPEYEGNWGSRTQGYHIDRRGRKQTLPPLT